MSANSQVESLGHQGRRADDSVVQPNYSATKDEVFSGRRSDTNGKFLKGNDELSPGDDRSPECVPTLMKRVSLIMI